MNAVTSTITNLPEVYSTKAENYGDCYSKTRVVLSLSNQYVLGVQNGLTEPAPGFTKTDTPDVPTDPERVSRRKQAYDNLFSILYLISSGAVATGVRKYENRTSVGGLGYGQQARNASYTNTTATARRNGGPATRSY